LAQFVEQEVASGKYGSEVDVLCEGLRLLQERQRRLRSLRADIQAGLDQLDRGEGIPLDVEAVIADGESRGE
jgi:antitoxin ParD1/3/4